MNELFSLLSESGLTTGPDGWEYASIIIGALGALGLWVYLAFFRKGGEKRKPGEAIKNFFCMRGNFAEDMTQIVYFYASIKLFISSLQIISFDFWTFLKTLVGQLVLYRFFYEVIMALVRKHSEKK